MHARTTVPASLLAVLALAIPACAAANPAVSGEFSTAPSVPGRMTLGPDGNVWATVKANGGGNDVIRVKPDGTVDQFDVSNLTAPVVITSGPGGDIWVGEGGALVHFSPANPTVGTRLPVAGIVDPRGLVVGSDGNLWTDSGSDVIRVTPAGTATAFPVATASLQGMKAASDGNVYVADDSNGGRIIRVTPAGATTPFAANTTGIRELAEGPGGQFAFTAPVSSPERIGLITPPAGGTTQDVANIDPSGVVYGNDGAYWIADFGGGVLTRLTTTGQTTTLTGFTANAGTREIVKGAGDTLWVNEENATKIARVSGVAAPAPPTPTTTTTTTTTPTTTPGPTPTPPDTTAPVISALRGPVHLVRGTTGVARMTLSEPASLAITVQRITTGRRSGGACRAATRRLRHAKPCTRYVAVGTITAARGAGPAGVNVGPKVGRRTLAAGRYRLVVVATDAAGNHAAPAAVRFTVTARR